MFRDWYFSNKYCSKNGEIFGSSRVKFLPGLHPGSKKKQKKDPNKKRQRKFTRHIWKESRYIPRHEPMYGMYIHSFKLMFIVNVWDRYIYIYP